MKEIPALTRLLDLDEVAAVFTYTGDLQLQGAAVPQNYSEQLLEQLILRIDQVLSLTRKAQAGFREVQLIYEGHILWVKAFGHDQFLVLFLTAGTDISLLRQPVNLAVVNLDSSSQRRMENDSSVGNTDLLNAAYRAEMELLQADRPEVNDDKFLKLALLAEVFLGPAGSEILEYALRDQHIELPFTSKAEMIHVVDFAARLISNVEYKKMFLDECAELMERLECEFPVPDEPSETTVSP